jgi:hypothetical protein
MDHPLSLKILTWSAIAAAAVSMFATPALSQDFKACLQSDGTQCTLVADTVGISIGVGNGDATIAYYVPAQDGWKIERTESVNQDMESQVLAGTISEDDAAYAFAELLSSHDLSYKIPENVSQLKTAVGFAPQAVLSPQDQVDVIAAHLQMSLGVSAVTADYLVMKLGLVIIPTRSVATAEGEAPKAAAEGEAPTAPTQQ